MRRLRRFAVPLIALFYAATGYPFTVQHYPPPGERIRVSGHFMHLHCDGKGAPVVVMDAGLGGTSLDWSRVQPNLSNYSRVCTYDRAGYGWSDSSPLPRTSKVIVRELRGLLKNAGVGGPYVLVGHSFGGLNMQLFAREYPADTAALVLVDSSDAYQFSGHDQGGMPMTTAPSGQFLLFYHPEIPAHLPVELQWLAQQLASLPRTYAAVRGELSAMRISAMQVRDAPPLPDVPVVILTRGRRVWPDTPAGDRLEQTWSALQNQLAGSAHDVTHIIATHSGHYIQLDQPNLVIDAIRKILDTVWRTHPTLAFRDRVEQSD